MIPHEAQPKVMKIGGSNWNDCRICNKSIYYTLFDGWIHKKLPFYKR